VSPFHFPQIPRSAWFSHKSFFGDWTGQLLLTACLTALTFCIGCADSYRGSITGQVSSEHASVSGTPVPYQLSDATVTVHSLESGKDIVTVTNEVGWYGITDVPFGPAEVTVSKDGYIDAMKYADVERNTETVLDFLITEETTYFEVNLTVKVTDTEGQPIPGATIMIFSRSFYDSGFTDHLDSHLDTEITDGSGRAYFMSLTSLTEYQVRVLRIDAVAFGYHDGQVVKAVSYSSPNLTATVILEHAEFHD